MHPSPRVQVSRNLLVNDPCHDSCRRELKHPELQASKQSFHAFFPPQLQCAASYAHIRTPLRTLEYSRRKGLHSCFQDINGVSAHTCHRARCRRASTQTHPVAARLLRLFARDFRVSGQCQVFQRLVGRYINGAPRNPKHVATPVPSHEHAQTFLVGNPFHKFGGRVQPVLLPTRHKRGLHLHPFLRDVYGGVDNIGEELSAYAANCALQPGALPKAQLSHHRTVLKRIRLEHSFAEFITEEVRRTPRYRAKQSNVDPGKETLQDPVGSPRARHRIRPGGPPLDTRRQGRSHLRP
mmetsp:Transcript_12033/g.33315  ORF Transcript_12033/g.33315 Transcript_12033/m.33315 type:complete len:295 (-) Transcript_12033:665-1549(-)